MQRGKNNYDLEGHKDYSGKLVISDILTYKNTIIKGCHSRARIDK